VYVVQGGQAKLAFTGFLHAAAIAQKLALQGVEFRS
jgi:hypothetical protein